MAASAPVSPIQRARARDTEQIDAVGQLMQQLLRAEESLQALSLNEDVTTTAGVTIARAVITIQAVRDQLPNLFLPVTGPADKP